MTRAAFRGFLAALAAIFVVTAARAEEAAPRLRSFEFSAEHGPEWRGRARFRSLYCALKSRPDKKPLLILFCDGNVQDNFVGAADDELFGELERIVAVLNLAKWEKSGRGRRYSGEPEWGLAMVREGGSETSAGGALISESPPNFFEAEETISRFFQEKARELRAHSPRQLESFSFERGAGTASSKVYGVHMSQNQRSIMLVTNGSGGNAQDFYIDESAWREFLDILESYPLSSWHGFHGLHPDGNGAYSFRLLVKYDTMETVEAEGSLVPPGSMPERFENFTREITDYFEKYRRMYETSESAAHRAKRSEFREFFFSYTEPNENISRSVQINRVMTPDGVSFHLISERAGEKNSVREFLLAEDDVEDLRKLIDRLNLKSWDRFRETVRGADKAGFMLSFICSGGPVILAHGRGKFPDGYAEKRAELLGYFDELEARQR